MSISSLHIFHKQTDATASLKGYSYQVLKTVETWIENFNRNIEDEIYCDFEEDIFEKNQILRKAKFRQIKLYSSNFSFASEEVNKCIVHFFMLHIKTDYNLFDKEFLFEANTTVAQKRGDNDAELLREWFQNQTSLKEDLLDRCVIKVKSIVEAYIKDQAGKLKEKIEESIIEEALKVFSLLKKEEWIEFVRCIKWDFKDKDSEVEFVNLKINIESQLQRLPFPIDEKNLAATFGLLHATVWEKASTKNPDGRKLLTSELKELLLTTANDNEIWYWTVYDRWINSEAASQFNVGEFYEVLDATRHCRQHSYLSKHDTLWKELMRIYIEETTSTTYFQRAAIYEYLWLKFRPRSYKKKPVGNLIGESQYFGRYFADFGDFKNAQEIEDAQSLINISLAANKLEAIDIDIDTIENWFVQIEQTIVAQLELEKNPNEICHLLENLGSHLIFRMAQGEVKKDLNQLISPFGKIFSYINQADFYNITRLSDRVNKYIGLLIEIDPDENADIIETLEKFTENLYPLVEKRSGAYNAAKVEIEKGYQYLKSDRSAQMLRALNCFHKAKILWHKQEYVEGFVLSLLSISELYSAIGMNLAAKYYALAAAWVSINNGQKHLLKRISDAFSLIFNADFKQGAWMNAIISFIDYMNARHQFHSTSLDPEIDKRPFLAMSNYSILIHATPKLSTQLKILIDSQINILGELGDEYINPTLLELEEKYPDDISMKNILESRLTDRPLNDVGKKRTIRFNALGTTWEINFENNFQTTPIAEEFCGLIQIILAEIALSKYDFHLIRNNNIKIELEVSDEYFVPKQMPSNEDMKWCVCIQFFDSSIAEQINMHTAHSSTAVIYILGAASLLPDDEFKGMFQKLFIESGLAEKSLVVGSYQRMWRYLFRQKHFDSLQRQYFNSVETPFSNLPNVSTIMDWKSDYSSKYNQKELIENIENRYRNSYKCIHLTLDAVKKEDGFREFISDLRGEGWQDWQIILTVMNFILNFKTHDYISKKSFLNKEQFHSAYNDKFRELLNTDEADCYVEFTLNDFMSKEFRTQLNHTLIIILESYGLTNNARFPNFQAIKDFLDLRFNMANDISENGNPIADIS